MIVGKLTWFAGRVGLIGQWSQHGAARLPFVPLCNCHPEPWEKRTFFIRSDHNRIPVPADWAWSRTSVWFLLIVWGSEKVFSPPASECFSHRPRNVFTSLHHINTNKSLRADVIIFIWVKNYQAHTTTTPSKPRYKQEYYLKAQDIGSRNLRNGPGLVSANFLSVHFPK